MSLPHINLHLCGEGRVHVHLNEALDTYNSISLHIALLALSHYNSSRLPVGLTHRSGSQSAKYLADPGIDIWD